MQKLLYKVLKKYQDTEVKDLSKFLFLFQLGGKPCTLKDHYVFQPAFDCKLPKRVLWKVARQLGKTTNAISLPNLLRSILMPDWTTLTVAPRFEQAKRISTDFTDTFIRTSEFKSAFTDRETRKSVLSKTFTNNSIMYFSYAYLDPGAIRGIPGVDDWKIDEIQDMNWDFIPIIRETASASPFGFETFCGTPKTLDNTIERLWRGGTQSELIFTCKYCNTDNIPSIDHDLEKMIGKLGPICKSCGRPIDVYAGRWVARFPNKAEDMVSRHLAQIVHPLHSKNPQKWKDLLYKVNNYTKAQLYNEVFGESYDTADKLFSESDLVTASVGVPYDIKLAKKRAAQLRDVGIGVDWTGGGIDSDSHTAFVVGGTVPGSDLIEVVYIVKVPKNMDPIQETQILLNLKKHFNAGWIAHDFGGVGRSNEFLMLHNGVPKKQIIPFDYTISTRREIVYPLMMDNGQRKCFEIDKVRSIVVLSTMLKASKIKLPDWESMEKHEAGNPLRDLLNVYTEQKESLRGSDVFYIRRSAGQPDDVAHALNLLCTALWFRGGKYPDVAEAMRMRMSKEAVEAACPEVPDWFS